MSFLDWLSADAVRARRYNGPSMMRYLGIREFDQVLCALLIVIPGHLEGKIERRQIIDVDLGDGPFQHFLLDETRYGGNERVPDAMPVLLHPVLILPPILPSACHKVQL